MELLEARQLLAGNVLANVVGGNLLVVGDGGDNDIGIAAGSNPGEFVVFSGTGSPTTINGDVWPVTRSGVVGSIVVVMGVGADRVSVGNVNVAGTVSIDMGAGDSYVVGSDGVIGGNLLILSRGDSQAASVVSLDTVTVGGSVRILTGQASATLVAQGLSVAGTMNVRGSGNGTSRLTGCTINKSAALVGASVDLDGCTLRAGLVVVGNASGGYADLLGSSVAGPAVLSGGPGRDWVNLDTCTFSAATVIRTAAGTDVVSIDKGTFSSTLTVRGNGQAASTLADSTISKAAALVGTNADLTGCTFGAGLTIAANPGGGDVELLNCTVAGPAALLGGAGSDSMDLDASIFHASVMIRTVAGTDVVSMDDCRFNGVFALDTGADDDTLNLGTQASDIFVKAATFQMGAGDADLAIGSAQGSLGIFRGPVLQPVMNVPAVPRYPVALALSDSEIELAWMPASTHSQDGFYLDRATDSAFSSNLVTTALGADVVSCSAANLTPNTQYHFRIRAYANGASSANSAVVDATTRSRVVPVPADVDLRTAIAQAQSGDVLQLASGTYWVDPSEMGGGPLNPPDDVTVQGVGTDTVIKVKDAVGNYQSVFGGWCNQATAAPSLNGFALRNLEMDLNPTGYGVPGSKPGTDIPVTYTWGNWHTAEGLTVPSADAAIFLTHQTDGIAVVGVTFDAGGMWVVNVNGGSHTGASRNAIVSDCTFNWQPVSDGDYDHNSLYFDCANQYAINNTIHEANLNLAHAGGSGIELHGGPGLAVGNAISGVFCGINLVANGNPLAVGSPSGSMLVEDNTLERVNYGVEYWADSGHVLRNVTVRNNDIHLANAQWSPLFQPGTQAAAGVFLGMEQTGSFSRLSVINNAITFEPTGDTIPSQIVAVLFNTHSNLLSNCVVAETSLSGL